MKSEYREWLDAVADEIAEQVEADDTLDVDDLAHESADGSEYAIYYGKAAELVADAEEDEVDSAYEDARAMGDTSGYWTLQSTMAFFILRARIIEALRDRGIEV